MNRLNLYIPQNYKIEEDRINALRNIFKLIKYGIISDIDSFQQIVILIKILNIKIIMRDLTSWSFFSQWVDLQYIHHTDYFLYFAHYKSGFIGLTDFIYFNIYDFSTFYVPVSSAVWKERIITIEKECKDNYNKLHKKMEEVIGRDLRLFGERHV